MTYYPIPLADARAFLCRHFGRVGIPAGCMAYWVEGVQFTPPPGCYLLAGVCGGYGVYLANVEEMAA